MVRGGLSKMMKKKLLTALSAALSLFSASCSPALAQLYVNADSNYQNPSTGLKYKLGIINSKEHPVIFKSWNPNFGSVTSVSNGAGNILFNLGVTGGTTAAVVNATLNSAAAYTIYGNFTSGSAVPAFGIPPMLAGGTGAALTPTAGSLFYSTASVGALLGIGLTNQGLTVSSGLPSWAFGFQGVQALTSATTLTNTSPSYNTIALGSGGGSITFPQASTCSGKLIICEKISGAGAVTLASHSGDTLEGSTSVTVLSSLPYGYVSDGVSTWRATGMSPSTPVILGTTTASQNTVVAGPSTGGAGAITARALVT